MRILVIAILLALAPLALAKDVDPQNPNNQGEIKNTDSKQNSAAPAPTIFYVPAPEKS
jgi:hypothetical protein